ncbi:CLUMA_CG014244, isoform A [Clunio marinus]|uniref:Glyoxylate reductase/hydroxypyruvate reductase n=1 Tax=Clunio marinus TaxID=568069 RepID=A0A1J1IR82_9DIPT|nr:CLUMA_CG014244, isoform A [Clunio marinus]
MNETWKPKVLVTHTKLPAEALHYLRPKCELIFAKSNDRSEILKKVKGVDGLLWASFEKLDAEVLNTAGTQLKSISVNTNELDNVDVLEIKRRNIKLGYTPILSWEPSSELAIGLALAAGRRFFETRLNLEKNGWDDEPQTFLGVEIRGALIGIVGFDGVGQAIAKDISGFSPQQILYSSHSESLQSKSIEITAKLVTFDELIEKSDFVFITASLKREMFNADVFERMKPTSVLINVARGDVVDQEALYDALKKKKIFAAGIDVMAPEMKSINDRSLMSLPNCVITSNMRTSTLRAAKEMSSIAALNVLMGLGDQPMFSPKSFVIMFENIKRKNEHQHSYEMSEKFRNEGNLQFKKHQFKEALVLYNKSLCNSEKTLQLGLAYGNRSAVYFELKLYEKCLDNIRLARTNNYPSNKMNKLISRENICKKLIQKESLMSQHEDIFKISHPVNKKIPFIADCLKVCEDEVFGRFVVTDSQLDPGDVVAIEEPFFKFINDEFCHQRCSNCLTSNQLSLIPCENCTTTMYCSTNCKTDYEDTIHQFECCQKPQPEVLKVCTKMLLSAINIAGDFDKLQKLLKNSEHFTVFDFDLSDERKKQNYKNILLIINSMALSKSSEINLTEKMKSIFHFPPFKSLWKTDNDLEFLISFFVKLLRIHNTNVLEMGEHNLINDSYWYATPIGSGLCPFISLINHNCDANVTRTTLDNKIVLIVKKPIKKGEQIFISYGYSSCRMAKTERQMQLQRYGFACTCEACENDYRQLSELPKTDESFEEPKFDEKEISLALNEFKSNCRYIKYNIDKHPCYETSLILVHNDHLLNQIKKKIENSVMALRSLLIPIRKFDFKGWRPKVLVQCWDCPEAALNVLHEYCDVTICDTIEREETLSKCKGMDGIFWVYSKLDKEILDTIGPQLKAVSTFSIGIDHIDVNELKRRKIPLGNTQNVLTDTAADIAMGLLISTSRRFLEGRQKLEAGEWQLKLQWNLGFDIKGSTVGIVGFGAIGQTVAKRLTGFDVGELLYCGHNKKPEADKFNAKFVTFDELIEKSDFVFIICPSTTETRKMFNAEVFGRMKPTSVLINVARGDVVDQEALYDALKNKKIFAAGIDVMTPEPLPSDHPLLTIPNCTITPHLGSATVGTRDLMAKLVVTNLLAALNDEQMPSPAY